MECCTKIALNRYILDLYYIYSLSPIILRVILGFKVLVYGFT